jgi:uncharacterized protein YhjY with autotransporter beta-barrel domain
MLALDRSDSNFVNTGAGLDFALSANVTGFIAYQNDYSPRETRNTAKAGVGIRF